MNVQPIEKQDLWRFTWTSIQKTSSLKEPDSNCIPPQCPNAKLLTNWNCIQKIFTNFMDMKIHRKTISIFLQIHMKIHGNLYLSATKIHEKSLSFRKQISTKSIKNHYLSETKFHQNMKFTEKITIFRKSNFMKITVLESGFLMIFMTLLKNCDLC